MSLLLKLPPELRNIVYDNCATEIVISKKLSVKRCLQHRDIMSLRLACTQTNVELKNYVSKYATLKCEDYRVMFDILDSPETCESIRHALRLQLEVDLESLSHIFGVGYDTYDYWLTGVDDVGEVVLSPSLAPLRSLRILDIVVPKLRPQYRTMHGEAILERMKDDIRLLADFPYMDSLTGLNKIRLMDRTAGGDLTVVESLAVKGEEGIEHDSNEGDGGWATGAKIAS